MLFATLHASMYEQISSTEHFKTASKDISSKSRYSVGSTKTIEEEVFSAYDTGQNPMNILKDNITDNNKHVIFFIFSAPL